MDDRQYQRKFKWLRSLRNRSYKSTAFVLLHHCVKRDYCWPSLRTIQEHNGLDPKTIRKHMERLAAEGISYSFSYRKSPTITVMNFNTPYTASDIEKFVQWCEESNQTKASLMKLLHNHNSFLDVTAATFDRYQLPPE